MSLNIGTMTLVKDGTQLYKEFKVNVGVHQGSVLSQLLFAFVIDFVPSDIQEGTLQKILFADDVDTCEYIGYCEHDWAEQ